MKCSWVIPALVVADCLVRRSNWSVFLSGRLVCRSDWSARILFFISPCDLRSHAPSPKCTFFWRLFWRHPDVISSFATIDSFLKYCIFANSWSLTRHVSSVLTCYSTSDTVLTRVDSELKDSTWVVALELESSKVTGRFKNAVED